jgi:hypothetical protein
MEAQNHMGIWSILPSSSSGSDPGLEYMKTDNRPSDNLNYGDMDIDHGNSEAGNSNWNQVHPLGSKCFGPRVVNACYILYHSNSHLSLFLKIQGHNLGQYSTRAYTIVIVTQIEDL